MIQTFRFEIQSFKLLWANDVHFDSPYCRREQFLNDCKKADKIIISGDFWDAMEGAKDKRSHKKDDALKGHYINKLVDLACDKLEPFKEKIIGWNMGNHELGFSKHSDFDLTGMVLKVLGVNPVRIGMRGYYILRFVEKDGNVRNSIKIYFQHNSGSNGKRSKGALAADLLAGEHPDADIWITEHSHRGVIVPLKSASLNRNDELSYKMKYFIQGLTYKAEDEDVEGESFGINKGFGMLPIGGIFLDFEKYSPDKAHYEIKVNPYFKI
jgi:hypothetical protein